MSPVGSVTQWIGELKAGNRVAAQEIWNRYFDWLVRLARKRLRGTPQRVADAEDVALCAFARFCHVVEGGQFQWLHDRVSLRRLLAMLTAYKVYDLKRYEGRRKRIGPMQNENASPKAVHLEQEEDFGPISARKASAEFVALEQVVGREPLPEFAAQVNEECERLLSILGDKELRRIAEMKRDGHTDGEIAACLGWHERTIERRLALIRSIWKDYLEKELAP